MPSNIVTGTNKKTPLYVYRFCIFFCPLDFKSKIERKKNKKKTPGGHSLNLTWDAYFWDIKFESLFNISSFQFSSCLLKIRFAEYLLLVLKMWENMGIPPSMSSIGPKLSYSLCFHVVSSILTQGLFLVTPTGTALLCFSAFKPMSLKPCLQKHLSC